MAANNLSYQFKNANVVVKLIVINLAIFLLLHLGSFLFQIPKETLTTWFVLPDELGALLLQPWSLISYAFIHYGFWHLFWNMIVLYWFGPFVLDLFTTKRFLTIYLLGAICGGLLYVVAYNLFPAFMYQTGYLLGASAGVRAIMIFAAAYTPNTQIRIFIWNLKLWHVGVAVVLLDILQLSSGANAGGMVAHLGGALFGYVYALQLGKGNDIGRWFENFMDWITGIFKPRTKKPFTKVHRTAKTPTSTPRTKEVKPDSQVKIDAILDKIGKSGYESLTKAEKDYLFKAGKE